MNPQNEPFFLIIYLKHKRLQLTSIKNGGITGLRNIAFSWT